MEDQVTPGMSAIILAAGANTRLSSPGVVPPFMKPLLLVNGRPLIKHALDHAHKDWHVHQTIIVVGPENAKLITDVVLNRSEHDWVLQPRPLGVVEALDRALPVVEHPRTLILCADNTFRSLARDHTDSGMTQLVDDTWLLNGLHGYVGVRSDLPPEEAGRFTRVSETEVWIGPLLLPTRGLHVRLENEMLGVDGTHQRTFTSVHQLLDYFELRTIEMRCEDLGIPEAL